MSKRNEGCDDLHDGDEKRRDRNASAAFVRPSLDFGERNEREHNSDRDQAQERGEQCEAGTKVRRFFRFGQVDWVRGEGDARAFATSYGHATEPSNRQTADQH